MKIKSLIAALMLVTNVHADIINGDTDPVGSPRDLSINTVFAGYDSSQTTSVKNHILTHLSNDNLRTFTDTSKLFLHNTTLELDGTYTFSHGSIEVTGNVKITSNSSNKFRFESSSLLIAAGSSLTIGSGVNFEFAPTSSHRKSVYFEDSSSKLILENSTLTVDNGLGMHLVSGHLIIKGSSIVDNTSTNTDLALFLGAGPSTAGDCKFKIESGAKLTVKNAGIISKNQGEGSFDTSNGEGTLVVEPTSNFIFDETTDFGDRTVGFNFATLQSKEGVTIPTGSSLVTPLFSESTSYRIFDLDWVGTHVARMINGGSAATTGTIYRVEKPSTVTSVVTTPARGGHYRIGISPNGKYIATASNSASAGNYGVYVYYFDSINGGLSLIASMPGATIGHVIEIQWSPDSRYILASQQFTSNLRLLRFDAAAKTLTVKQTLSAPPANGIFYTKWSPNGRKIAATSNILNFDQITETVSIQTTVNPTQYTLFDWSPDGQFLSGVNDASGSIVRIFDTDLNIVSSFETNPGAGSPFSRRHNWHPYGKLLATVHINTAGSTINNFKMLRINSDGTIDPTLVVDQDTASATEDAEEVQWSPDGTFLGYGQQLSAETEFRVYAAPLSSTTPAAEINDGTIKLSQDLKLENINLQVG